MPTPFDDELMESGQKTEPKLEPKAPPTRRRGAWVWVLLMLVLLLVLAGVLFISARTQFNNEYERALNNIMLQQGNVVATLGAGK